MELTMYCGWVRGFDFFSWHSDLNCDVKNALFHVCYIHINHLLNVLI